MKTLIYSILAGIVVLLLVIGCEEENGKQLTLSGKLISNSECKSSKTISSFEDIPDSVSCLEYSFDALTHKLLIKHINAGFNCCPESLYCTVSISSDTLLIHEFEKSSLCNCDCLYDLNIEVSGVDSKKYQIRLIEPYCGEQEQIIFGVDFSAEKEDSYCVIRKQYPWGK